MTDHLKNRKTNLLTSILTDHLSINYQILISICQLDQSVRTCSQTCHLKEDKIFQQISQIFQSMSFFLATMVMVTSKIDKSLSKKIDIIVHLYRQFRRNNVLSKFSTFDLSLLKPQNDEKPQKILAA